jgi:hypothetical protein
MGLDGFPLAIAETLNWVWLDRHGSELGEGFNTLNSQSAESSRGVINA